jgi:hypothetical protein
MKASTDKVPFSIESEERVKIGIVSRAGYTASINETVFIAVGNLCVKYSRKSDLG